MYIGKWWQGAHGNLATPREETPDLPPTSAPIVTTVIKSKRKPSPSESVHSKRQTPLNQVEAATIIQRSWRKHIVSTRFMP